MNLPNRKNIRLKNYDYSLNGAYFVTICTHNRKCILSEIVGEGFQALPQIKLSEIGKQIEKSIHFTHEKYDCIDKYVIMPNHVHIIVKFYETDRHGNLSLQDIIGRLKSYTTSKYNEINNTQYEKLWQRSFYEHIIRNEKKYQNICEYIETNPQKWKDDSLYTP